MGEEVPKDALVIGRRKVILVTAGIAVLSLVAGMVAASRITSPGEAAANARPPQAGDLTVPVEVRELRSDVVTRGDAVYDGTSEVVVETGAMAEPAMVTGGLPEVGDELKAGQVILELAGRPVIALAGDLPVYRSLTPGMSGPDVAQLKAALGALGFDAGDSSNDEYDQKPADAVAALFDKAGYEAPLAEEDVALDLDSAEETAEMAQEALDDARQELQDAQNAQQTGTQSSTANATLAGVAQTGDEGSEAGDTGDGDASMGEGDQTEGDPGGDEDVGEEPVPPDPSSVADAQEALDEALVELGEARAAAGTPLPASEVVYLPKLPRRVDSVGARRGKVLEGSAFEVSGADLVVHADLSAGDASLVEEGMDVAMEVGDDTVGGKIVEIGESDSGDDGDDDSGNGEGEGSGDGDGAGNDGESSIRAVIEPEELTAEQVDEVRGTNLRITIPVEATDGEVLAVPLAALTAGPDGESRVEVAGQDDETTLVEVEVGLAAEGFAEIKPGDHTLSEGDQVVVGR